MHTAAPTAPAARRFLTGPTGLGTSAARRHPLSAARIPVPELHCPPPLRDAPALGAEVNDRLVAWAARTGNYTGRLDHLRDAGFGRMLMLVYPRTDDVGLLLAIGRCVVAAWAVDDCYCDDEGAGAAPELLGTRLALATSMLDPPPFSPAYALGLERAVRHDPVLAGLRSAREGLLARATPVQVARACREMSQLFQSNGAEAAWRTSGRLPTVWEYLVNRQLDSFACCLALVDAAEGYQLPAETYEDPRVRRAFLHAALAGAIVNDLYGLARENAAPGQDFSLPVVLAAEQRCSLANAVERSARIHDDLMHAFEDAAAALVPGASPELVRFLAGLRAWLGGNRAWHATSGRYRGV
ncbi:family 2 encapsulin nanocompartment cargo protein terpene cyclase [Streptomyces sp. BR1]|uniref:family 2 encapsulin nanocompartment cargo protein terpene cyclase n=1 Tax=Streptomyces sp. BR1 TaxID=1592323 RepID=UPI00402BCDE8